ncbi:TlpA disulfide reductase family protein [uncultured Eudoraea sp.]|uniref:TlpA family protein disulfide reductase n=1 Tax=uncultured Eudoraea sp. TaxID=1035614 RepID=UPI002625F9F0|nr:TlpA disulfide reductase family protein [uncultured Eudoraea sp.]
MSKIQDIITLLVISINCFGFAQIEMDSANVDQMDILKISVDKEAIYEFQGKELPEFKLVTINGDILNSNSLKGKPTLVNFWFDSCAPCIEEMPILNEIRSNLIDVNFIAITFQDKNQVSKFLERKEFNFIHLIEAKDYIKKFGLFGYPKSLILDKNLVIVGIEKMIPKDTSNKKKNIELFKNRILKTLTELKQP